jgi:hypothetical protein
MRNTLCVCACVFVDVQTEHTSATNLMNLCIYIMLGIFFGGSDIAFAHTLLAHSKRNLSAASPSSGPITEALQKVLCVFKSILSTFVPARELVGKCSK